MIGHISKSYKFSTIVSCEDLQKLNGFIASEYKFLKYKMTTIDGTGYEIENFNEILDYDNADNRKIEQIIIYANKEANNLFVFYDFEMRLTDLAKYSNSISYTIKNVSEKEIIYYTNRLHELILNFKSKNSWLYKPWASLAFLWMLWMIISISFSYLLKDRVDKTLLFLFQMTFSFILGWLSDYFFRKIVSFLFPESVFYIGKQIDFFDKKKKIRQVILNSVIIGFVISVLASFLVFAITK